MIVKQPNERWAIFSPVSHEWLLKDATEEELESYLLQKTSSEVRSTVRSVVSARKKVSDQEHLRDFIACVLQRRARHSDGARLEEDDVDRSIPDLYWDFVNEVFVSKATGEVYSLI